MRLGSKNLDATTQFASQRDEKMEQTNKVSARRTNVDEIFSYLYEEISTLKLRPGDKISEAELATKFGVSRQPVRDAFSRLENLDLLVIRPKKATMVKRFSRREIEKSRFVRASVDAEILRRAAKHCDASDAEMLAKCLEHQALAIEEGNYEKFGQLDYKFHKVLCEIAQADFAFEVISTEKSKVDRLCMLGLANEDRMPQLLSDHAKIVDAITTGNAQEAVNAGMRHLSRLDSTIEAILQNSAHYFEDELD